VFIVEKKLLFFVDDYGGGAGNVIQILSSEISKRSDFTPVVVVLNPHSSKHKLSKDVKVIEYSLQNNWSSNKLVFFCRNIKAIRSIVYNVNPDAIISFINNINTIVCLSLLFNNSIPIIVSERSNPLAIKPFGLYRFLRPIAYRRANIISVQCDIFRSFMPNLKDKMVVTPNPVLKPMQVKSVYNFDGLIKLVSCARLDTVKRFDLLIEIFAELHKTYSNTQLTIWGEGPERQKLENLIAELGLSNCVLLPGSTQDIYAELCESDIYLMTSAQEGFPNALCEAMACGLPVIAFECHKGLRDIIDNYKNGILVDAGDSDSYLEALQSIIVNFDLRANIGKNAKYISEKFSIDIVSNLWIGIINRITNENNTLY